jgi:hypothetical protein
MKCCILFTDVKSSSKLWATYGKEMLKLLIAHEKIIRSCALKGLIVKTIGDAFMIKFSTLDQGIKCAIDIQQAFRDKPLKFNKSTDLLQIRIGIAYGDVNVRHIEIQNHKMNDFFGTTVNMASRMESKVSTVGGFGVLADSLDDKTLELLKKHCKIQKINFKQHCIDTKIRSARLIPICHDASMLHIDDNKDHVALSCEIFSD